MKIGGNRIQTEGVRPWRNSPGYREYVQERKIKTEDPAKIQACLTCQRETCSGNCFTKDKRTRVIPPDFPELYASGMTLREIAAHYGVAEATPGYWRDKLSLPKRRKAKKKPT